VALTAALPRVAVTVTVASVSPAAGLADNVSVLVPPPASEVGENVAVTPVGS
jgi:hypothetical protein